MSVSRLNLGNVQNAVPETATGLEKPFRKGVLAGLSAPLALNLFSPSLDVQMPNTTQSAWRTVGNRLRKTYE